MANAELTGPPTDEYPTVPYDFEQQQEHLPVLTAGVFTQEQLDLVLDPAAGELMKLSAIGAAMQHENPDLWGYVQKSEYGVDPDNPLADREMLFRATADYAQRQLALQQSLQSTELAGYISSHDRKLLSVANIEEKQALISLISAEQAEVKYSEFPDRQTAPECLIKVDDVLEQERTAANKLLKLLDDNDIFSGYLLGLEKPVDVRQLIQDDIPTTEILTLVEALHVKFKQQLTPGSNGNVSIPSPGIPGANESPTTKTIKEQTNGIRGVIVQRIQKATVDLEQVSARQKLTAAAITGMVAAVTIGGIGKNSNSPFPGFKGKPSISRIDPESIKIEKPSQIALRQLKILPTSRIPKAKRNLIIETGGTKYAEALVAKFNAQNGTPDSERKEELQRTIRKIDAIAIAGLKIAANRKSTTVKQADEFGMLASKVMLGARSSQVAEELLPKPEPANQFQQEITFQLEAAFSKDPGIKEISVEDRARIFGLQARLMDELAPEYAETDIIEAFIAHVAAADGQLREASAKEKRNQERRFSRELQELNPRFTLAQLVAATSIIESGYVADPKAKNWAHCKGFMQWCYWDDRAAKYLGDRNAPKTTSNQVIMVMKEWDEVLNQLGSGDATAAAWLKGPGHGRAIASLNKIRYQNAARDADGNGTSVLKYMALMEKYVKTVDVHKQLPFLKEVMRLHPNAMDWSKLDKEWPLYSYHRLRQVKPHANEIVKKREQRIRQAHRQAAARHERKYKAPADRSERARAKHIEGAVNLGMYRVYVKGERAPTRLYAIEGFLSSSQESKPGSQYYIRGAKNRVIVGARHAENVVKMFKAAKQDDIKFYANSSLRKHAHQEDLWEANPNRSEVAPPGRSGHEDAIYLSAIDLNLGKGFSFRPEDYRLRYPNRAEGPNNPREARNSPVWRWLNENARKYGYEQYFHEPWHWQAIDR